VFASKLIDGTFPDYARVIPNVSNNHAELDRISLVAGLERLAAVANGGGRAGVIWNGGGNVSLSISEADAAEDEIEADLASGRAQ
jgi:DNA polymerase-3 subunit beta